MSKKINKRAERELKKISKTTENLSELLINYQYDWKNEGSVFDIILALNKVHLGNLLFVLLKIFVQYQYVCLRKYMCVCF